MGPLEAAVPHALSFTGVSHTYATGTAALVGVDLRVEAGDFVVLVGPSGCGKSTLLRLAASLEVPSAGQVQRDAACGPVSFVFQDANLLPWRTIAENVALPLQLAGKDGGGEVEAALDRVGLHGFGSHYPRELSGGMRMRASLARALITRPKVLLLDEPFSALDEITRERLQDDLLALHAAERFTALFVTHSVFEAAYLADRVVIIGKRPGRVVDEVAIGLPRPRPEGLRTDAAFGPWVDRVARALRSEL